MARVLAQLALISALACAPGPANPIADEDRGAPGVRRVLLCPPNLVLGLRSEIQGGATPMDREVAAYLEGRGWQVERLGLLEGRKLWAQALEEARTGGSVADTAGLFVRRLAEGRDFDVLVIPSLILHQTRADASNASWDGVSRRMRIQNAPRRGIGREDSTLAKGVAFGGISGPVWVTSLHVMVFARDARRVFEGRGGIEFLHEIDFIEEGRSRRYELRPNGSIFLDSALLHEAVVRAFDPYLAPPEE